MEYKLFLYPVSANISHNDDGQSCFDDVDIFDLSKVGNTFLEDASKAFLLLSYCARIYFSHSEADRLEKISKYLEDVDIARKVI